MSRSIHVVNINGWLLISPNIVKTIMHHQLPVEFLSMELNTNSCRDCGKSVYDWL